MNPNQLYKKTLPSGAPRPSSSKTPETDAVLAMEDRGSGWLVAGRLEEFARGLERERNAATNALKEMLYVVDERCGGKAEGNSRLVRACDAARIILSEGDQVKLPPKGGSGSKKGVVGDYLARIVRHIGRDESPIRPCIEIKLPKGWLTIFYTHRPCVCWSDDGSIPQKGYNNGRWIIGNWWHYWRPFQLWQNTKNQKRANGFSRSPRDTK